MTYYGFFMQVNLSSNWSATNAEIDTKAVTAHRIHWSLAVCFLDNIPWFCLHFCLARSNKCICQSLKEHMSWGFKNCLVIPHACHFDIWLETSEKSYFVEEFGGNLVLKYLRETPEIKHMIDCIGKFQSDCWLAQRRIQMLRDSICS